jgi:hypothetical protein
MRTRKSLVALAALVAATADAGVAMAEPAAVTDAVRWQETPGVPTDGYYTFPVRSLAQPVNRVSAEVTGAEVEVRAVTPAGRWTEWQSTHTVAPFTTTRVQARLVADDGAKVSRVSLTADTAPATTAAVRAAPTYRVPATREGLVGRRTANGHVIQPNDHFVALPSRRALNADDQTRDYKVRVCNPRNGKCVEEPVWDVGPWNTRDDYWNPSNVRQNWQDLPQGKPEATAAYYQDYNNGHDQFGREVSNPSGIDLADGTWASLGMTGNDAVDVTYLWKAA